MPLFRQLMLSSDFSESSQTSVICQPSLPHWTSASLVPPAPTPSGAPVHGCLVRCPLHTCLLLCLMVLLRLSRDLGLAMTLTGSIRDIYCNQEYNFTFSKSLKQYCDINGEVCIKRLPGVARICSAPPNTNQSYLQTVFKLRGMKGLV